MTVHQTEAMPGSGMPEFRRALFGLRKKDVLAQIVQLNENLTRAREVYNERLEEMRSANDLLAHEKNMRDQVIAELKESQKAMEARQGELLKKVRAQEDLNRQLEDTKEENQRLMLQIEQVDTVETENLSLKRQLGEVEAVTGMRQQQQAILADEINRLKRQNRVMHEGHLAERRRLETEIADKKLSLAQLVESHRFAMEETRTTLNMLSAQFEESAKILSKIRVE